MMKVMPQRDTVNLISAQLADQLAEVVGGPPTVEVPVGLVGHIERGTYVDVPTVVYVELGQAEMSPNLCSAASSNTEQAWRKSAIRSTHHSAPMCLVQKVHIAA